MEEAAKVRKIYEVLVLKKAPETVVQIGSVAAIKAATPAVQVGLTSIQPANGNGHSNGNGNGHTNGNGNGNGAKSAPATEKPEAAVAGD